MMTLESLRLSAPLQALVDARLDTIDRMLLGVVPRQDRLAIARDLESQIHEQLQDRNTDELSRDDVLSVLASLDPPEAYLPEETGAVPSANRAVPSLHPTSDRPRPASSSVSGILGIVTLAGAVILPCVVWMTAMALGSDVVLFLGGDVSISLVLIGAILSISLAARVGLNSAWTVTGLVTGFLAMILPVAVWMSALSLESESLLYAGLGVLAGLVLIGAIVSIALATRFRLNSAWAVTGLVTGLLALPVILVSFFAGFILVS